MKNCHTPNTNFLLDAVRCAKDNLNLRIKVAHFTAGTYATVYGTVHDLEIDRSC